MTRAGPNRDLAGAVVLDAFVTGLNAARALHRRGVRVALVAMGGNDLAQYSRVVSEWVRLKAPPSPATLLGLLEAAAPSWKNRVLIPASDLALETLSRYRDRLARHYRIYVPEWPVARRLLHKDLTREAAAACGIEMPLSHGELDDELASRFEGPFPALVRPFDGARFVREVGSKVLVAANSTELREHARRLRAAGLSGELLELIPGPDSCSYNYTAFLDENGRLVAGCALHKLRKHPPFFGIARVVETLDDAAIEEALREPVLRLLRHIRWFGPISAEYKLDPRTGRFVLIEINARMAFVFRLALARGIDFAWLSYLAALDGELATTTVNSWDGVLIHLQAEVLNAILGRRREQIGWRDYLAPYRRRKVFAVWDARDPLPFLAEWSRTILQAPGALPGRRYAKHPRYPLTQESEATKVTHS